MAASSGGKANMGEQGRLWLSAIAAVFEVPLEVLVHENRVFLMPGLRCEWSGIGTLHSRWGSLSGMEGRTGKHGLRAWSGIESFMITVGQV